MTLHLCIWKDGYGIPRAWGQHENEEQADAIALEQLKLYRMKRPELTGWTCVVKKWTPDADGNPVILERKERK